MLSAPLAKVIAAIPVAVEASGGREFSSLHRSRQSPQIPNAMGTNPSSPTQRSGTTRSPAAAASETPMMAPESDVLAGDDGDGSGPAASSAGGEQRGDNDQVIDSGRRKRH